MKETSINYKEILSQIKRMSNIQDIKQNILKMWIYKDKCVVIDYLYKGSKFAFDINIDKNNKLELFLVDRSDNIVYMYKKTYKQKVRLESKIELSVLEDIILKHINSIFSFLDSTYKYDVSVIIPVYNREKLIQKCIDRLNNQTFDKSRYEVIFVDDHSSDNSVEVIRHLVYENLNYTILERPISSGNASIPRNEGLRYAQGKYVFFLDSDDYVATDCLEKSYDLAEKNCVDVIFLKIGSDEENPRGVPIRPYASGTIDRAKLIENHLSRTNPVFRLYKKSFLLRNGIVFDPTISVGEDKLYTMSILSKTQSFSILADKAYVFITAHDGEHLSRKEIDLQTDLYLYLSVYNWIFISNFDLDYRNKLYNVWTIKIIERLISILRSKKINNDIKQKYFANILTYINIDLYTLEKKYIYKEFHHLLDSIVEKKYQNFFDLVNEK